MADVAGLIARAVDKVGFVRERFVENRIPTDISNVVIMPFFADLRHTFIASSLLMRRYREEEKGSKYFVLASWPGQSGLFPYVDEYWSLQDEHSVKRYYQDADGFNNRSDLLTNVTRNLNNYFFDVLSPTLLTKYYQNGLTNDFWKQYHHIKRSLPMVPSTGVLPKEVNRELANRGGYKVFIYPAMWIKSWRLGKEKLSVAPKEFYVALIERLLKEKFVPVVYRGAWTYDLSQDYPQECIYITDPDVNKMLGVMRSVGCVLDTFSGISRMALAARCPFLALDERARYASTKDWEIDDLCGLQVPKEYIFSFATILDGTASAWNPTVFNSIVNRLNEFLPELNRDIWPSTVELNEVISYDSVRKKKNLKVGAFLFKVPKE